MDDLTMQLCVKVKQEIDHYGCAENLLEAMKAKKVPRKLLDGKKLLLRMIRSYIYLKRANLA